MTRPVQRNRQRPPGILLTLGLVGVLFFALPFVGLLRRVPWSNLVDVVSSEVVVDALVLSLVSSTMAALVCVVLGVPLAWLLARIDFPGRNVVRALVTLPMVLPPVVGGAALLFAFGRRGTFGGPIFDATTFVLPFSFWGVVVANVFVAMPFLIVTVEGALRGLDQRYEDAAASLGVSPLGVFWRVTLPMIGPSLGAGLVLAWARSLGEFGATVTFAGNLQGRTQTLPLAVFVELQRDRDSAVAISLLMVVVSLIVLVALRDRWWRR
ncbi:MAG: ABC transporter permease [Actinomycetota bacterium]